MTEQNLSQTIVSIENYVRFLKDNGIEYIQKEQEAAPVQEIREVEEQMDKAVQLEKLREEILSSNRCPLHKNRTNMVLGEGSPDARLVFVGEAPGQKEDELGRPFVGRSGNLLTKIIEAMGLKREEVYICNVIKCRPPENRDPKPEEIEQCEPFLIKQLDIIQPEVICTLGRFAAQTLLKTKTPISKLRGNFELYNNIKLMPTFHPAAVLRNPNLKRDVWDDMQQIMGVLGLPVKK